MSTGPEGIVAGAVGSVGTGWNVFVSKPYKPSSRKLCWHHLRNGNLRGHLIAPAVSPPTRCFSISAKRMTTGTMAMSDAAKSWAQFC
jgi:hypothetical protein